MPVKKIFFDIRFFREEKSVTVFRNGIFSLTYILEELPTPLPPPILAVRNTLVKGALLLELVLKII